MEISKKTGQLLGKATVIDGHSDILIPMAEGKMNIRDRVQIPPQDSWVAPPGIENHPFVQYGLDPHTIYFGCMGQYDIPRWRDGGITSQLCAIYLDDSKLIAPFQKGMDMVHTFHRAIEENKDLLHCTTVADIAKAKRENKIGVVLTFEGCEALGGNIEMLDLYYKLGLRAASLTHTRRNKYADGCWAAEKQGGLTSQGRQLIQRMMDLKIVIDLVHIGYVGFWEILEITDQPVILSHSTPTMFPSTTKEDNDLFEGRIPRPRLELPRDKDMLEAIAKNGGVLGMIWIFYRDIENAVDDIETAMEIMGPDHVGLGSDMYGHQAVTPGLEDISQIPQIVERLLKRGHSDETIEKFLGENYLRVFREVWGS